MKKTKIVATIGPASENREALRKMIESGMNVARLNFSHGAYEWHGNVIKIIRELADEMKRPIGILADLQGPRIRVGNTEPFEIEKGEIILVSDKQSGDGKELIIDSPGVAKSLKKDERILIEDGLYELKVLERAGEETVKAEVINGGIIKPRKGINIPDTELHFGAVTEKDEKDLEFVLKNEVDFVALSFVSNAREIEETREKMKKILGREDRLPHIVSKIERKEAIKNIDEIIKATDVVMVARGDLGIEMDESKVIIYQKEIIAKCLKQARPVIVATQMLDSMISNPIPTRAEVSDVTNAVVDHTDAVMLSGESANGKYPIKAVATMKKIIHDTEESSFDDINGGLLDDDMFSDYASIINGAHELAKSSKAKAIVMFSDSGFTARMMSHHRPEQMMMLATGNEKTYNQMAIVWGIRAYLCDGEKNREDFVNFIIEKATNDGKLKKGDKIVIILGRINGVEKVRLVGIKDIE